MVSHDQRRIVQLQDTDNEIKQVDDGGLELVPSIAFVLLAKNEAVNDSFLTSLCLMNRETDEQIIALEFERLIPPEVITENILMESKELLMKLMAEFGYTIGCVLANCSHLSISCEAGTDGEELVFELLFERTGRNFVVTCPKTKLANYLQSESTSE